MSLKPYNDLKTHLKSRYGEPVQRVPLDAGFSCPHKVNGKGGCIYCDSSGSGFTVDSTLSLREQLESRMEFLRKKGIRKFMAYFQANSNTFAPVKKLRQLYREVIVDDVVILDISTRPDLVSDEVLDLLEEFTSDVDVILELGLQSINPNTIKTINRGHTLSHFIDSALRIKKRRIDLVVHMISNLPWDTEEDVAEAARLISVLGIDGVKLHSLYVVEGTELARMYEAGEVKIGSVDEFLERVVVFLEHLDWRVVVHRLVSDPPNEGTMFGNWGMSKIKLLNMLERKMIIEGRYQGSKALFYRSGSEKSDRGKSEESPDSMGRGAG
ncbi:radical SAM protein [Mesotoga sp. H07.pep.5.3]|nr:radical SAM protein [Mesotoga sp. H07.pep.5.3]